MAPEKYWSWLWCVGMFFLALGLVLPASAEAQDDSQAPVLAGFSLAPTSVDVSGGAQAVTLTFAIIDDISGFVSAAVALQSPSSQQIQGTSFNPFHRISGDALDGEYQVDIVIPQSSEAGTWSVRNINLIDVTGNTRYLYTADIGALGVPTQLEVVSAPAPLAISLPDIEVTYNEVLAIPIQIGAPAQEIVSAEVFVAYDGDLLELDPVTPVDLTGALTEAGWSLESNWVENGHGDLELLKIAMATDDDAVTTAGTLAYLRFTVRDIRQPAASVLEFVHVLLNDGDPENAPNPFNPETSIRFDLPQESVVRLEVFDAAGQKARTLIAERCPAGAHRVMWDGTDETGAPVSSGIYLYRLRAGTFEQVRRMLLIK